MSYLGMGCRLIVISCCCLRTRAKKWLNMATSISKPKKDYKAHKDSVRIFSISLFEWAHVQSIEGFLERATTKIESNEKKACNKKQFLKMKKHSFRWFRLHKRTHRVNIDQVRHFVCLKKPCRPREWTWHRVHSSMLWLLLHFNRARLKISPES